MRRLSKWIIRCLGWKIREDTVPDVKKAVLLVAPHTSNWDFVIGRLAFNILGIKARFLIKKEAFFFPLGLLLKKMGGIPVDRNKNTNLVSQLQQYFNQSDELMLIITPEGTRSYVKHWKRGFYFIAQKAGVPVIPTYLDYEKKVGAMLPPYYLTDDIESDFKYLTSLFADKTGRHPEKYNPSPRLKS